MSSTHVHVGPDNSSSLPIQDIINRLSHLKSLTGDRKEKADSPEQTTVGTSAAGGNRNENEQDRSTGGGVSHDTNKQGRDDSRGTKNRREDVESDGDNIKMRAVHELGKLNKEFDYLISLFKKLKESQHSLSEPLKTLEDNVYHIVSDLRNEELPRQVLHNLSVLRNNISRFRILIPVSENSEGSRPLQTTITTACDLPHLYGQALFEESYYFDEIKEKYESLDSTQKPCLLCFAIFPENAEIKKRLLRFWWIGEKLIPPQEGKDEKGVFNDILNTYVEKGLIEPVQKNNKLQPISYRVDPIVRSCLIRFAKCEGFFDYDQGGNPTMDFSSCYRASMVKFEAAPWFSDYLKGGEIHEEQVKQEPLPIELAKLQMMFNFPSRELLIMARQAFDKLQTLFNLSKSFPALPTEWFSKMTALKVLYLGKWETTGARPRYIEVEEDYLKGLKFMKNLRFLSLQGITGIQKVPKALSKLENLRILDLRACHSLEKLPDNIGSLQNLTYLDLSECYLLDYMPRQLSYLCKLEVLKGFVIADAKTKSSCTLSNLSLLENLRKLSIYVKTTKFDIDVEGYSLGKFQKLEKLKVAWRSRGIPRERDSSQHRSSNTKKKPAAAKASTKKENKAKDKANSKTMEPRDRFKRAANVVIASNKRVWLGKAKKELRGLENLVKLDLRWFPYFAPPNWLVPTKMVSLRDLSIRGGRLGCLELDQDARWRVDTLRLKFLMDFKMNWLEMTEFFPRLNYLDIERSPGITFCPCDANGVWRASSQ